VSVDTHAQHAHYATFSTAARMLTAVSSIIKETAVVTACLDARDVAVGPWNRHRQYRIAWNGH
jgi:hypothetical protein